MELLTKVGWAGGEGWAGGGVGVGLGVLEIVDMIRLKMGQPVSFPAH